MNFTKYYVECGLLSDDRIWFKDNQLLETIMGSQAYGCQNKDSDIDFISIVMPKHEHLFPQQYGYILGFDSYPKWQSSELKGIDKKVVIAEKEIEGEWVSLVNFFYKIAYKGSPNLVEVLFAKRHLVTFGNEYGWRLRDNRHKFLSMRIFHSFKGYCFQQLQRIKKCYITGRIDNKTRTELIAKFKYDVKMASHSLRLLDQIEQIITTGDLDLMRNREEVKAMRNGEWGPFEKFEKYVLDRLKVLEELALKKTVLPYRPPYEELKVLLLSMIEDYYGSVDKMIVPEKPNVSCLENINSNLNKVLKHFNIT